MPLFVLSPASLAHSAFFAGYYTFLSGNVAYQRANTGVTDASKDVPEGSSLRRAVRAHANFVEYTPLTFLLLFLAELNGAPTKYVHAAYFTLFVSRVASSVGLLLGNKYQAARASGFIGTLVVLAGSGLYNVRSIY
ncbi:hypothetical protein MPSI1_000071 [Malassezia psittaci]|uniref:Uncharacterized protein n=1 Tax=Malassezia psittaci TaxID=1821823 RepID=A0AAF0JCP3_9BASI|nr:hypothetical protein MPSI1_000071 [Malassezia psittaci]